MTRCHCALCQRNRAAAARLATLTSEQREFWSGIYDLLLHAEMDLDVAHAVIDGSWPGADEWIARKRA